jgi:hypothetical protein
MHTVRESHKCKTQGEASMSTYDEIVGDIALAELAWEERETRRSFRTEVWTTKDGRQIAIKDMGDGHLLNAYKHSQSSLLFREMVLRLFEERVRTS